MYSKILKIYLKNKMGFIFLNFYELQAIKIYLLILYLFKIYIKNTIIKL
jgi:hypothetical protein